MRALHLLSLGSSLSVVLALGACGASSNGANSSPQGEDGGSESGSGSGSGSSSGGSTDSGMAGDSAPANDGPFVQADHLPFPQLVYQSGPIMTAPKIVSITFAGDPNASTYDQLGQGLASSKYWDTVRQGYCETGGSTCIGDGPTGVSVQLTTAAAASYTDQSIQTWLQGEIANKTVPAPDATSPVSNTLYVVYFPMSTSIDDGSGAKSCTDFDGYHGAMMMGSQQVPYAVVDECDYGSAQATLAATTETTAHEVFEAASDPGNPAGFYLDTTDPDTWGWNDVVGGEAGDLCVDMFGAGSDATSDGTFAVQRIWSNALAKAGGDPCNPLPAGGGAYFNVSPSQSVYVLDVGGSVTFDASAFSTAPTSDWTLLAQDWTDFSTSYLSFAIQGGTATDAGPAVMVNNGSKPKITVTLLKDPGGAPNGEADGVLLSVTGDPSKPTADHIWPFIVVSPADAEDAGIDAAVSKRPRTPRIRKGTFTRRSERR